MDAEQIKILVHENLDAPQKLELMEILIDELVMSGIIGEPGHYSELLAAQTMSNLKKLKTIVENH